jgi:methyl-accepting chemotaxis protein WspA
VAAATTQLANRGQTGISRMADTMQAIMDAAGAVTAKLAVLVKERPTSIRSSPRSLKCRPDQFALPQRRHRAEKAGEYGLVFAVVALKFAGSRIKPPWPPMTSRKW